ncbi:PH domain-containing protein [Trichonephila clavata]|uniref:PH domain-containing protein n=1 Tax=Trichonephila clavata TaxID=2740835 RepID=A0A8X6G5X7_TRICU|nr:PH domain-containing protein [Trichonephila clavata]
MTFFSVDACGPDKDDKSCVSVRGMESISFLQNEQIFVAQLIEMQKLFSLPIMRRKVSNSEAVIQDLNETISYHQNVYEGLISGKRNVISVGKDLPSCMKKWASYYTMIQASLNELQKNGEMHEESECIFSYLYEPASLFSKFEGNFLNLCDAVPGNSEYRDILESIQSTFDDIVYKSCFPKNAVRILQLQRLLIDRQPKILSASRILLKEGCLYKVNYRTKKMKKMALMLFDDFLLICKIQKKPFEWCVTDSLKCYAVLPLQSCSVNFASRCSSVKGSLFKVKCWNVSYLLMSKVPCDVQSWIQVLQSAIRRQKGFFKDPRPCIDGNKNKARGSNNILSSCFCISR